MSIEVRNIQKRFHNFTALENINLEVKSGELVALLGPSGSGKTTLLRIIAGLESADSGTVLLNGENPQNKHVTERDVGFVFQHYALFKHMSVFENVAFGLRVRPKERRLSDYEIRHKVMDLLKMVHLEAFFDRLPRQLSGGQRQRVALARALAVEPKILLLDEPFGALDAKVRKELRRWLRRLHNDINITSVFVTHDQEEAMEVSDRVVIMSNGHVEQIGTPEEVYHHPANSFVYDFLGNYNEFDGWKDVEGNIHLSEYEVVEMDNAANIPVHGQSNTGLIMRNLSPEIANFVGRLVPSLLGEKPSPSNKKRAVENKSLGKPVKLYARPHEMFITDTPDDDNEYIMANIIHTNPAGSLVKMEMERKNGTLIQLEIPKTVLDSIKVKKGDWLYVRPKNVKVFE